MSSVDISLLEGQLEGTSATFSTWLVKQGDRVNKGDPVAELETDKVAMEVCANESGVIVSLEAKQGDEVTTGKVLGKINTNADAKIEEVSDTKVDSKQTVESKTIYSQVSLEQEGLELEGLELEGLESEGLEQESLESISSEQLISPAVRRLLRENHLSIGKILGTGKRGRVTRDDVLAYLKNPQAKNPQAAKKPQAKDSVSMPVSASTLNPSSSTMIPHSNMRKSIAKHMVDSLLHTSPHVTSVFEMDMSRIIQHRKANKESFQASGAKLTFTAYFLAAMVKAVQAVPQSNARFHEEALEIFSDVNIGVGTALGDKGLVVPVVEKVQAMNLLGIAQSLTQQTLNAREGKLTPADMRNGTITISNHGVSGSLFATPIIINQPEVAILGVGKLEKRVVVEEINGVDAIIVKPKCYVSLSIDHRALDAHQTNQFLNVFVDTIENWDRVVIKPLSYQKNQII